MVGLFAIGVALVLGICLKIAGWSGALLVFLIWLALVPSTNNPLVDQHVVYMALMIGLATIELKSGEYYGLGKWWKSRGWVKKCPILE
jgi:thiosulfate dehydrogenase [quinone] large subunit